MTQTMEIALVGAAAAIVGGLVSGAYQHCRDYFSRPKLEIDYEGTAANKVEIISEKIDGIDPGAIFIRARVRNTGRRTAKGTREFLASLQEVISQEQLLQTSFHDAKPLAWAGWDFKPRDIPPAPNVHFYVDLTSVLKKQSGWRFSVENGLFAGQTSLTSYRGTYRFHLIATANNAEPATCAVDVSYDMDWHNLRAVAAPKA